MLYPNIAFKTGNVTFIKYLQVGQLDAVLSCVNLEQPFRQQGWFSYF
ncbi:hypothetical protein [Hymenobacter wooponensis]|nr:hypothetical protein [Hymenobacter wooponensis]